MSAELYFFYCDNYRKNCTGETYIYPIHQDGYIIHGNEQYDSIYKFMKDGIGIERPKNYYMHIFFIENNVDLMYSDATRYIAENDLSYVNNGTPPDFKLIYDTLKGNIYSIVHDDIVDDNFSSIINEFNSYINNNKNFMSNNRKIYIQDTLKNIMNGSCDDENNID